MKTPPLFATVKDDLDVQDLLLGTDGILRVFEFGNAPQKTVYPYVVWQLVAGYPHNYITCTPKIEELLVQVDCYAETQDEVRQVAEAMEAAIETTAQITAYRGDELEQETKLWRSSFDITWFVKR